MKPKPSPKEDTCPDFSKISSAFREAAQDAFAKLQALEEAEFKAEIFYQPAYQEANVAIHKAQARAHGPCETGLVALLKASNGTEECENIQTILLWFPVDAVLGCTRKQVKFSKGILV